MTKWPVITCVYFAFCTFTTVGFGDINPTERQEKEHELDHANAVDSVEEAKPEEQFNEEQKIMLEVRRNLIWKKKTFFFSFFSSGFVFNCRFSFCLLIFLIGPIFYH